MEANIKKILNKIESNGFEAYVVGGYVRDFVLGKQSHDVDIATNALLKDLNNIFDIGKCDEFNYGSYHIKTKKYEFDITTYREESKYLDRRPTKLKYVNNLMTDINRRDFTINSLCMNKNGIIIDILGGKEDIINKKIKVIGNIKNKFKEDPLRMLRALRFAIILGFTIEEKALEFIINNKELICSLSYQRKRYEIDLILMSENVLKGFNYLNKIGVLNALDISYTNITKVDDLLGMWAQIKTNGNYPFTKSEQKAIKQIKEIVAYGKIDNNVLFNYDLYICQVAGSILKIDKKEIYNKYDKMSIHNLKDIKLSNYDIIHFLNINPSIIIKEIMEELKNAILDDKLINKKSILKKYIITNKSRWV